MVVYLLHSDEVHGELCLPSSTSLVVYNVHLAHDDHPKRVVVQLLTEDEWLRRHVPPNVPSVVLANMSKVRQRSVRCRVRDYLDRFPLCGCEVVYTDAHARRILSTHGIA